MSGEKPGKTTVKFNREEGENIVGEVEGDRRPVYVNKKSIRPRLGDIWACHLNVINESGQECYLAILKDKLGFEEPAKASDRSMLSTSRRKLPWRKRGPGKKTSTRSWRIRGRG